MKKVFIVIVMWISIISSSSGQSNFVFPDDWTGKYEGDMYLHYPTANRIDTVHVDFELEALETSNKWSSIMTYNSAKYGERIKNYIIIKPDSLDHMVYQLDEQDGIIIDQNFIDDTFYSSFTVAGMYITSRMRRIEGGIEYEVITSKEEKTRSTKNRSENPEEVFVVDSYPPYTIQRVLFSKVH